MNFLIIIQKYNRYMFGCLLLLVMALHAQQPAFTSGTCIPYPFHLHKTLPASFNASTQEFKSMYPRSLYFSQACSAIIPTTFAATASLFYTDRNEAILTAQERSRYWTHSTWAGSPLAGTLAIWLTGIAIKQYK